MTDRIRYFLIYWLPVGVYCTAIFIQSSYPSVIQLKDVSFGDKYLHLLGYSVLGILFFRAFRSLSFGSDENRLLRVSLLSIAASSLYGISDEIHQAFVLYRSADAMDALADMVGSCLGVSGCYMLWKNHQISEKFSWMDKLRQFM